MSVVAAGMIAATGLKLLPALKTNRLPALLKIAMIALTFIAIAILHVRLAWVLLVLGGLGALWAYRLRDEPQPAQAELDPDSGANPPSAKDKP